MEKQVLAELAHFFEPELTDAAERIMRLLGDETLCDMCTEYEECTKCLRLWASSQGEHQDRVAEYTELLSDLQEEIVKPGDLYLLCSDGLHSYLKDDEETETTDAAGRR